MTLGELRTKLAAVTLDDDTPVFGLATNIEHVWYVDGLRIVEPVGRDGVALRRSVALVVDDASFGGFSVRRSPSGTTSAAGPACGITIAQLLSGR